MPKGAEIIPLFADGEIAAAPSPLLQEALAAWNETATAVGWHTARILDEARRRSLNRAIKDYGGLVGFRGALETASKNAFLLGQTPREKHQDWKPDLDWFITPKAIRKLLEDRFPANLEKRQDRNAPTAAINWRAVLETYKGKGRSFWHHSFGPCPEEPGPHKAPSEMIDAWRARQAVPIATPAPQETREQRMAFSIVAYRRHGQYDRANKLEQELANLENRPAVLVPSPDAPNPDLSPRERPQTARTAPAGNYANPQGPVAEAPRRRWSAEALDAE